MTSTKGTAPEVLGALNHYPMKKATPVVYFQETIDKYVYVGGTDDLLKRNNGHARDGKKFLAALPGSWGGTATAEESIQRYYTKRGDLVRGKSTFSGDHIQNYVAWLVSRGYASADRERVEAMPAVPFSVWHPECATDAFVDQDGQAMLEGFYSTPGERVEHASEFVWLQSASDQWYTPPEIIDRARAALGGTIDTDPASCAQANKWIGAGHWYSINVDGLARTHPWSGTVWLNPPYGSGDHSAAAFVRRLVDELRATNVTAAITCLNLNSACANWFDTVWDNAQAHLIYRGRVDFIHPTERGSSPSKGTILSYFGPRADLFAQQFGSLGRLIIVAGNR